MYGYKVSVHSGAYRVSDGLVKDPSIGNYCPIKFGESMATPIPIIQILVKFKTKFNLMWCLHFK